MINHKELFLYVIKEGEVSRMIGIIGAMEEEVAATRSYSISEAGIPCPPFRTLSSTLCFAVSAESTPT